MIGEMRFASDRTVTLLNRILELQIVAFLFLHVSEIRLVFS